MIAQGAYRLARSAVKAAWLGVVGAAVAAALGIDPLVTPFAAGLLAALVYRAELRAPGRPGAGLMLSAAATAAGTLPFSLGRLFWVMLKIGATLFMPSC